MTEQESHEEKRLVAQLLLDLKIRKYQINSGDMSNRRMRMEKIKCLCEGLAELYEKKLNSEKPVFKTGVAHHLCFNKRCRSIVNDFENTNNDFDYSRVTDKWGNEYFYCYKCTKERILGNEKW